MGEFDPARWEAVQALFERAVDLPLGERARFLKRECGDEDVRREVASLLAHDSGEHPRGVASAIAAAAEAMAQEVNPDEQLIGARLGPYRLLAIAGHGGMGAVYRASRDDGEFRQQVAIKLVRAAAESPLAQQKFRQERQILARLAHPNIARLLDGGSTPEGLAYLVMEFIEGEPITNWCDLHALSVEQRLRLFLPVCEGVEAAHRERVIHRDLKPTNILVTKDGVPKLLDFGIAKMLDPDEANESITETRFRALTPEYAAPEQILGESVSPGTDVYALGLVLYELLTGCKAQGSPGTTPSEIEKTICRVEPKAAASLNPQLAGDIDRILRMAIRKEPERRYRAAAYLGEDIQRYLTGKPVAARPDTFTYRAGKFLQRNRVSLRASLVSGALVVCGLMLLYWLRQAPRAPRLLQVVRLTQGAHININERMVTDGSKLYFTQQTEGRGSLAEVPVSGGTPKPLPVAPLIADGSILDISPDGSELLVEPESENGGSVYIVPIAGGSTRKIEAMRATYAIWSRDGRHILYTSGSALFRANADGSERRRVASIKDGSYDLRGERATGPEVLRISVFKSDMMSSAIWEMAADGSGLHALLPRQPSGDEWLAGLYSGDWIFSGRYYLVRSRHAGISTFWVTGKTRASVPPTEARLEKLYSTPLETREFTSDPNGKRIYFAASQSTSELTRYDFKRRQFLPFLRGVTARQLDFSKDGRQVAYTLPPQETLWKSSVDGSGLVQLTSPGMRVFRPRWSPDSRFIAFTGSEAGKPTRAYVIPSSGGTPELLDVNDREDAPNWSTDGLSLVVTHTENDGTPTTSGIYIVDWKTRKSELLRNSELLGYAAWSPDGRYMAARNWGTDVKLLEIRTGRWSTLANHVGHVDFFWSRDSHYIVFQDLAKAKGQPVFRVRIRDGQMEELVNSSQIPQSDFHSYQLLGLAPDGAPIASITRTNSDIYALDVDLP